MSEFITVARVGEIPEGQGRWFPVEGRVVAVFRVADRYYALDDYCPHMGASLGESPVYGDFVICSQHRWAFDLRDGSCPDVPRLRAQTFEVRVLGEEIQVRLPTE